MTHPLTDEICIDLGVDDGDRDDILWYAKDMRAAADWQLEQVIKWLGETEFDQYYFDKIIYASDLKKAMRPQEDN